MDTGSACSRFTMYGQRVFLGMLCYGLCHWNIHKLFTGTIFSDMDAYYLLEMKLYTHQVDLRSTGRYYDDVNITNGTLHSRLVIYETCQRQILRQMSPSSISVYTQGYACSNLRT